MKKLKKPIIFILILSTFVLVGCGSKSYSAIFEDTEFSCDSEFDAKLMESVITDKVVTLDINQLDGGTELIVNIKFTPTIPTNYELTGDSSSLIWLYDNNDLRNEVYFDKDTLEITNGSGLAKPGEVVDITYKGMLERQLTEDEIKEIVQMTIHFEDFAGDQTPLVCKISEIK